MCALASASTPPAELSTENPPQLKQSAPKFINTSFSSSEFSQQNLKVISKLKKVTSLNYLYEDLDFIYESKARECPGIDNAFFKKLNSYNLACSRIIYKDFGFKSHAVLIQSYSGEQTKKLLIYNHGHGGLPSTDDKWALELFNNLLAKGWDVLIVSMPLVGLDKLSNPVDVKTAEGIAIYDPKIELFGGVHAIFELMDVGNSHFMRFFIDNVVINAIELQPRYAEISYLGLSGGATTGLYACALLQDALSNCILVTGVMPANLRNSPKNFGDAEQISSSFHLRNPVMKVVSELSLSNTRLSLFYNSHDGCCFDGDSAIQFKEMLKKRNLLQRVNLSVWESHQHSYNSQDIENILSDVVRR